MRGTAALLPCDWQILPDEEILRSVRWHPLTNTTDLKGPGDSGLLLTTNPVMWLEWVLLIVCDAKSAHDLSILYLVSGRLS